MTSADERREGAGFTLLEVLIAFAILAVAMTALMRSFSTGLQSAARAEAETLAMLQAESKLAEIGREGPLSEGTAEGLFENGNRWLVTITRPEPPPLPEPAVLIARVIEVRVFWNEPGDQPGDERSLALTTLQLAVPE